MNFVSEEMLAEARRSRGARVDDASTTQSLDADETEFLEKLETSKREYERRMADEEAQQLQSFPVPEVQEKRLVGRKNPPACPSGMIFKVKPQAKKAKIDMGNLDSVKSANGDADKPRSCCS
ncbi:hypothetical protein RHSIM_Rhsim01G0082900 [Rhododendron simsii]|uniref:FAM192A/Fyv6 N-terminal domain-containing protein n=1 Tax=Rhododendron simsii TaxID=118357 RepID=A0A834HG22_RHOSS|nr:hypothetical protein RHSIM_Rhsim01G0082900 [Rhododendron simsii]